MSNGRVTATISRVDGRTWVTWFGQKDHAVCEVGKKEENVGSSNLYRAVIFAMPIIWILTKHCHIQCRSRVMHDRCHSAKKIQGSLATWVTFSVQCRIEKHDRLWTIQNMRKEARMYDFRFEFEATIENTIRRTGISTHSPGKPSFPIETTNNGIARKLPVFARPSVVATRIGNTNWATFHLSSLSWSHSPLRMTRHTKYSIPRPRGAVFRMRNIVIVSNRLINQ